MKTIFVIYGDKVMKLGMQMLICYADIITELAFELSL